MSPKIHILILNWNGADYLSQCIDSILKIDYDNYIVTVIVHRPRYKEPGKSKR